MKQHIKSRAIALADYILSHNATVRDAAKVFFISKSTVHKDVTQRLKQCDEQRYRQVRQVLSENLAMRAERGGAATKQKYLRLKGK